MNKNIVLRINDSNIKNNNNSHTNFFHNKNFRTFAVVLILIVISLSATYAYLLINSTNTTSSIEAGCFVVNYTGQSINNSSLQSTTDYTKGEVSEIVLSKNSNCEIYTEASIYIHTNANDTDAPLENGALKYKVMKDNTEISSGVIDAVTDGDEEQLLADNIVLTTTDTTYKVYLWIDPTVSRGAYNEKTYSGYIYASATQSSTIK